MRRQRIIGPSFPFLVTPIPAAGPVGYHANAVTFDGSTNLAPVNNVAGTNTKQGIESVWFKPADDVNQLNIMYEAIHDNLYLIRNVSATSFSVILKNAAATQVVGAAVAPPGGLTAAKWWHLMFSWNTATTSSYFYISDGTTTWNSVDNPAVMSPICITDGIPDFYPASNQWQILNNVVFGSIADLYINTADYLDLANETNRAKFRALATLKPVDLGATGTLPTGNQPAIYFSRRNGASDFAPNKGSVSGFGVGAGALIPSLTSPSD